MKNILLTFLLLGSAMQINAQSYAGNNLLDSLEKEMSKYSPKDTSYVKLLAVIGEQTPILTLQFWDSCAIIAQNGMQEASNSKKEKEVFEIIYGSCRGNCAYLVGAQGKTMEALNYHNENIQIQKRYGNKKALSNAYNNVGYVYSNQKNDSVALFYYEKALLLREEIKDTVGLAGSYNNIGAIYYNNKENKKALKYFQMGAKMFESLNNKVGLATTWGNIGMIHNLLGDKELAMDYNLKSLEINEKLGHKAGIADKLVDLGGFDFKANRLKQARAKGERALAIAQEKCYVKKIGRAASLLYKVSKKERKWEGKWEESVK